MSTHISTTRAHRTTVSPGVAECAAPSPEYAADVDRAGAYGRAEKAAATHRAYATDFAIFSAWCADRAQLPLPASPVTVAAFLAFEAGKGVRPSTIGRRIAGIRYAHKLAGRATPTD